MILTLAPLARNEKLEVKGTATPVEQGASTANTLSGETAKELPGRPATVSDALPMIPGVVRKPDGGLQISAAGEHRSALIVNSADVTDPATGQFGLTVPIDVVDTMNVYQTPFEAEYGKFTAGLVSVETRRGSDKWNWELNDPFPDFYIRSWQLRGLRDATPRINVEGPLVREKLYFSEGLEYVVRKIEVYTLPFPNDQKKNTGVNSFAQFDWIASARHLLTATLHAAPQKLEFVNLDYFNPPETTPDSGTHNYTATVSDHLTIFGGLLDNMFSATQFGARVWGKGNEDLIVTPLGRDGNFFADQSRTANRIGWSPSFTLPEQLFLGNHTIKVGAYLAQSAVHGQMSEHPISIENAAFQLTEQITFSPGRAYQLNDTESAYYLQDHWNLSSRLSADLGVRVESQEVSQSYRVAPRAGFAWTPFASLGTTLRAGFGFFYDHVPLNVYAFNHYPKEILTYYDANGDISAGPYFYGNALSVVDVRLPFVFRNQGPGNFSPQSAIGSLQVEQPLTHAVKLRIGYVHNQSAGLVIMEQTPRDPVAQLGANQLIGSGPGALSPVRGHGARASRQEARDVFLVREEPGARRFERLQQLPGQLPVRVDPAQPDQQPTGRPTRPVPHLGHRGSAVRLPYRAGIRSTQRVPLLRSGCRPKLRRHPLYEPLPVLPLDRFQGLERYQGECQILGQVIGHRLQSHQPLRPRSLPQQHRRPELRTLLRSTPSKIHRRFRRPLLARLVASTHLYKSRHALCSVLMRRFSCCAASASVILSCRRASASSLR